MIELDPSVRDFLTESAENLDQLDRDFVALEQAPGDHARLGSVFRTIHTIKGTCGFFGFSKLEGLTHVGENLLSRLRDGELTLTTESTTALLHMVDAVREMLAHIEHTGTEGAGDYSPLVARLSDLCGQSQSSVTQLLDSAAVLAGLGQPAENTCAPDTAALFSALKQLAGDGSPTGELVQRADAPAASAPAASAPAASATRATPVRSDQSGARTSGSTYTAGPALSSDSSEGNVRVGIALLDRLMTLVGELVLARNQILQAPLVRKDTTLARTTQRLNLITTELQEGVMKTRMQPIATVCGRFVRVVRDLSAQCGKQVRLEMEGQDTELDRTLVEAIKDPLTHVIRNAIDHGIEAPHVRTAAGKAPEGRLLLRAFHESGQVNIDISDDGGGIDPVRVRDKALERGLIDPAAAARMSERDLIQLVFLPGFSTAEKVSNISGRGVGMDVVRTNIEKIGGTVELTSRQGAGTSLRIKIPLTLAIIPALVVTASGERYCIPQVNLLELVRLNGDGARRRIETVHSAPVYRLRDRLLPLVDLGQKLHRRASLGARDEVNIVVLQADQRPFGLVVDGVNDTEEIVVKPLAKPLKSVPVFAGATIMGDGRVSLILDVLGLAKEASVLSAGREPHPGTLSKGDGKSGGQMCHLLLAGAGGRRVAIPLDCVSRLEELPVSGIENADGQEVIQYRGRIMPLIRLGEVLGCPTAAHPDELQVVVYTARGRSVGLVVDVVHDIAEVALELTAPGRRSGVLGSGVVQGRVTDLLDLPEIVRLAVPEMAEVGAA
jgi:two-component system chemotaxis sensor kinase CheA